MKVLNTGWTMTMTMVIIGMMINGCSLLFPQWTEQVEVRCEACEQTWTVQATTHVVRAGWCCVCGRELVLASRPCEEMAE